MKMKKVKIASIGLALLMTTTSVLAADYEQHWAKDAIEKWNHYGIVKGYENGDFRPSNPITRAELAVILDRVFKFPEATSVSPYMDIIAMPDKWYVSSVSKVTALELMHIEGFLFEPNTPVTREEAAYAIAKAYELTLQAEGKTPFKDESQISSWALEAVSTLAHAQYITGTPEGNFMPQGTLTRAEVVTMLNNMTSQLITAPGTYTETIKGNVIVSSQEITLNDLTIEGNLYLTSEVKQSLLNNVTVTGTVYISGGAVEMSGDYKEVRLASGAPISLIAGNIEQLVVTKAGSTLKVAQGAALGEVIQKSPITIENASTIGGGSQGGGQIGVSEALELTSAGIYISGKYVELPMSDDAIEIDIPSLSAQFNASDRIEGFKISANIAEASLTSSTGSMKSDQYYSFRELEEELGLITEIATDVGISPSLVINQLLGNGNITIGDLLDNYALGKALGAQLGYELQDSYTFERYLTSDKGGSQTVYITLRLQ